MAKVPMLAVISPTVKLRSETVDVSNRERQTYNNPVRFSIIYSWFRWFIGLRRKFACIWIRTVRPSALSLWR